MNFISWGVEYHLIGVDKQFIQAVIQHSLGGVPYLIFLVVPLNGFFFFVTLKMCMCTCYTMSVRVHVYVWFACDL